MRWCDPKAMVTEHAFSFCLYTLILEAMWQVLMWSPASSEVELLTYGGKYSASFRILQTFPTHLVWLSGSRDDLFYPAIAGVLPTTLLRIPYSIVESAVFTGIVYYVAGLEPTASRSGPSLPVPG